jgi:hypothetical protein
VSTVNDGPQTPLDALAHEIAMKFSRAFVARSISGADPGVWYAMVPCSDGTAELCLRYLSLSGHLIRHPDNPNLVRIKT